MVIHVHEIFIIHHIKSKSCSVWNKTEIQSEGKQLTAMEAFSSYNTLAEQVTTTCRNFLTKLGLRLIQVLEQAVPGILLRGHRKGQLLSGVGASYSTTQKIEGNSEGIYRCLKNKANYSGSLTCFCTCSRVLARPKRQGAPPCGFLAFITNSVQF